MNNKEDSKALDTFFENFKGRFAKALGAEAENISEGLWRAFKLAFDEGWSARGRWDEALVEAAGSEFAGRAQGIVERMRKLGEGLGAAIEDEIDRES